MVANLALRTQPGRFKHSLSLFWSDMWGSFLALWTSFLISKIGFRAPVSKAGYQQWRTPENTNNTYTEPRFPRELFSPSLSPHPHPSPASRCLPFLPPGVERQHEEGPSLNPNAEQRRTELWQHIRSFQACEISALSNLVPFLPLKTWP